MKKIMRLTFSLAIAALMIAAISINSSKACTRIVYKGPDNLILTGRSMDFSFDIPANLWIFPRGMQRNGEVGPNSIDCLG